MDFRRDIGIWAGITGIFHTVIGQCVHLRGKPWLYYVYAPNDKTPHLLPIRTNAFGLANFTGLFAAFVLLALLATSNDASLRKLGTPGWKQLQRWNYWGFGLIAFHTFAYQKGVEDQHAFFVFAVLVVGMTGSLQWAGWKRRRVLTANP
jgi:sulfoxide reductase heme-binding subunit YedZ